MREHLYQKCLRCPWLWGCGLWWCSQWWCWLWGCSTETPADPLGSPSEIIHNSGIIDFFIPFSHWSSFFVSLWNFVSSSGRLCFLSLPVSLSIFPSISFPTSTLPHLPGENHGSREWHHHFVPSPIYPSSLSLSFPQPSPSYSRCHHCMVWAPSRKSAC